MSEQEVSWNPLYTAYAKVHGRTEECQLDQDDKDWPGGKMIGFIAWVNEKRNQWRIETGEKPEWGDNWSNRQLKDFQEWLDDKVYK